MGSLNVRLLRISAGVVTLMLFTFMGNAQYCTPFVMDCTFDNIYTFTMNGELGTSFNDVGTPCPFSAYDDRTYDTITVYPGMTYSGTINGVDPYSSNPDDMQIYIDFNNDGIFDAFGGETVGGIGFPGVASDPLVSSISMSIPALGSFGVTYGAFRMRVEVVDEDEASYPSIDPCGMWSTSSYYFQGEVRDYIVLIASQCPSPAVTLGATNCTSQVINWAAVAGTTGYEYVVDAFSTDPTGTGTPTTSLSYTANGLTPLTTYYAHVRANCTVGGYSAWVTVPFTTSGAPAPIMAASGTVCPGATIYLTDATTGGTWSSGNNSIATVSGTGGVTGVSLGNVVISYTAGTCSSTYTVNINDPVGAISGTTTFCKTGTTTLSDATTGGTWSSANTTIATAAGTTIHGVAAGSTLISYSALGCSQSTTVTVDPNNGGTITGKDTVCAGVAGAITLSDSQGGGVWSSGTSSRATIDPSTGVVTGASAGTVTISYKVTNTCGTYTVTYVMHVLTAAQCAAEVNTVSEQNDAKLTIYPNPNGGLFTMNLSSDIDEEVRVVVTNLVGEKVDEFTTTTNNTVDVKLKSAEGIYLLSASTSRGRYIAKVVVTK